jgi:protein-disulfide isomerase
VRDTYPQLIKEYVDTGKVRYAFRNFPIESLHKQAFHAHEAAECAADQNKYWEMHDVLFANFNTLDEPSLTKYAAKAGLDMAAFDTCLKSGKHADKIRQDIQDAARAGANGTPIFFLALTGSGDAVEPVRVISGARPYAMFKQEIDALLADSGGQ